MKDQNPVFRRRLEITLLVLLTIVGFTLYLWIRDRQAPQILVYPPERTARSQMNAIEAVIRNYHQEYSRWPVEPSRQGKGDLVFEVSDSGGNPGFMSALRGDNPVSGVPNPRLTAFIESDFTTSGGAGIDPADPNHAWKDPWGNPYIVIIDSNYDKKIRDPSPETNTAVPLPLRKSILILSGGPRHEDPAHPIIGNGSIRGGMDWRKRDILYSWK